MQRQLERLERSLTWRLLAPDAGCLPSSMKGGASEDHRHILGQVKAARVEVFGVDDRFDGEDDRSTDRAAWHFVACERDGRIAGATRLFIVDRSREALEPMDVLRFGHVEFPSVAVRASHLAALERLMAHSAQQRFYIYAGGFFTSERWRGTGLAVVLGMAAIAMARLHNCCFAASFVSARDRAPELFSMLGGKALQTEMKEELAPFHCPRHGFALQLMTFDSRNPSPKVEGGLDLLTATLCRLSVLTPRVASSSGGVSGSGCDPRPMREVRISTQ